MNALVAHASEVRVAINKTVTTVAVLVDGRGQDAMWVRMHIIIQGLIAQPSNVLEPC